MAVTIETSGTQAATVGTEHSLTIDADAKVFVLVVDTVNMVNSDELELRITVMTLAAGTRRLTYLAAYKHTQSEPIKASVAVPSANSIEFTLKQTAGTGRSFPWAVWSIG